MTYAMSGIQQYWFDTHFEMKTGPVLSLSMVFFQELGKLSEENYKS